MSLGMLTSGAPPVLATAVGISVAAHLAVYALTPIFSLHLTAIGGTAAQAGLLFSVFSLVAVVLRRWPARGSTGKACTKR